ncbi:MAG: ribosomal protein bL12 [Candidatus Hodgkinia cicadicola]
MSQVSEIVNLISELKTIQLIELINELERVFQTETLTLSNANQNVTIINNDEFTVTLDGVGQNKINVIREIRSILNLGLKEAKEFVENVPQVIKNKLTRPAALEIKSRLEKIGAAVSLK